MIMQSHLESAVSNTTSFSHTLTHTHNTTLSLALFTHTVTCDQWFRRFFFYNYSTHVSAHLCSPSLCALLITLHGPVHPLSLSCLHSLYCWWGLSRL